MSHDQHPVITACALAVAAVCAGLAGGPVLGQPAADTAERPEEIIVTSSLIPMPRRQVGTAVSVIEGTELELRGYESLADVLRTQVGIGVSNSGGPGKTYALRIRGEENYRTMLMIDGVKAIDPTGPQARANFDSLLSTSDMERVEILRGPQGFMYGADAGGVVSIMTGRGRDGFGGRVGIEAGEFGTRKLDVGISGGSDVGDYYFSATDLETDGFNSRPADTALRDDDGADNTTLHTKLGWNATDNLRLQLVARDIDASTKYDNCFNPDTFLGSNDCVATTEQFTYKMSAEHRSGDFTNKFGYSDIDIENGDLADGLPAFGTTGGISRFEYTGSFAVSSATTLVYGLDLQDEEAVSNGESLERGQDGYYFEYQGELTDKLFLSAGARYDDNDDFGSHTSSRVTLAYTQDLSGGNSLKYRASYGTGFRAPSLFEISYNNRGFGVLPAAAATPLREETSRGADIGIEYYGANGLHFEATYFDQDIENAIVYTFDDTGLFFVDGYLQSLGTSRSKGIELGLLAPFAERWAFVGNWTNNDAKQADGTPRLQRPKNLGNLGVQFASANDALRIIASYRLSRDAIAFGGQALDDYEVLDASFAYALNDKLEIHGRVGNLFDQDYQEVGGYNTAGREAYAGFRLRF